MMDTTGNKFFGNIKTFFNSAGPLVALIGLMIFASIISPNFLTSKNLFSIIKQCAPNGLVALSLLLAILTGGIDLSVGSLMALSAVFMGLCVKSGFSPVISIMACLLGSIFLGWLNGIMLTKMRLPHPFITTMGTQNIFRGLCLLLTGSTPISGMPAAVRFVGTESVFGIIPVSMIILIAIYLIFGHFLKNTVLGRHIYAIGGNPATASLSGINVDRTKIWVYTLSGLMCGCAAILFCGRIDAVTPMAGTTWETDAIAAVIIGGTSFFGGRGNVKGTFAGVLLIAILRNILNLMAIQADVQILILGAVIILAVFIDVIRSGGFADIMSKNGMIGKFLKKEA